MSSRVLIIKPSSLGDVVNALAVAPRLRRLLPGCAIDWLVNREYAPLVAAAGIDSVIVFDRGSWRRWSGVVHGARNLWHVSAGVRRARYDLAIDLQGLLRSGWFAWISGAPRRLGFADAREGAAWAYTHRITVARRHMHAVECCLAAVRALGDDAAPVTWDWPGLDDAVPALRAQTGLAPGSFCVLVPGSRRAEKRWPAAAWAELAARIWNTHRMPIVLAGSPDETPIADAIMADAVTHGAAPDAVRNYAGALTLVELLALCRDSRIVVACDTGPLHMAVAAGARVVALMGPTHPDRHGPYGQRDHVVMAPVACAPCHGGRRRCGAQPECMSAISVDEVSNKVTAVLHGACGQTMQHAQTC